jgi:hypothetical protein
VFAQRELHAQSREGEEVASPIVGEGVSLQTATGRTLEELRQRATADRVAGADRCRRRSRWDRNGLAPSPSSTTSCQTSLSGSSRQHALQAGYPNIWGGDDRFDQ